MARKYTAQEMREASLWFYYPPNSTGKAKCFDRIEISAMLRQAADELERERKYEYASVLPDGSISCVHDDNFEAGYHAFRREVGEWEEVK